MKSYLDSEYFDLLDQVIKEPASRVASEKNLLAQILRASGAAFETRDVDPDKLYRELVSGRNEGRANTVAGQFTVLARPGEAPQSPPREGDILLRVALGHPGLGHVAVIADSTLWPDKQLASALLSAERQQPGFYAVVSEAGAYPHPRSQPFARRILDAEGRMPPCQLLLRPNSLDRSPLETDRNTIPVPIELSYADPRVHSDAGPRESWPNWEESELAEAGLAEVAAYETDTGPYDADVLKEEDTSALFERVMPEPPKATREEVPARTHILVVDDKDEPITEGEYAFYQGNTIERGKFSEDRKGIAYLSKIDPTRPFMFEVRDRVCAIRAGAFLNPDDPKIEYGGTRFDWTLVRDDKQADKNFWPYYQRDGLCRPKRAR